MNDSEREEGLAGNQKAQPKASPSWRIYAMGGFLLLIGLGAGGYNVHLLVTRNHTTATVLKVQAVTSSSGSGGQSTTYAPTVKFKDSKKRTHVVTPGYRSSQFNFDRGDQVPIIYNPNNPRDFRITTFVTFWIWPLVGISLGLFVIFMTWRCDKPST